MKYKFTYDWVSEHETNWQNVLKPYIGVPNVRLLEIGSFEGRSTVWFLENILTDESARITCIDHNFREAFYLNIANFAQKVTLISNDSQIALRDRYFSAPTFDIIYIDGNHSAPDVLVDAILSFTSLKTGGILIFDDYLWESPLRESPEKYTRDSIARDEPKLAIDTFESVFSDSLELLLRDYQIVFKKK